MEASIVSRQSADSEFYKILPNTLYLTFNAPQVDEYHRGIFLTYPPILAVPPPLISGTLFHASYISSTSPTSPTSCPLSSPPRPFTPYWALEHRIVKDLSSSKSLVLLYRLATHHEASMEATNAKIAQVLSQVPLGKEARSRELGEKNGNVALGGYDCVIWTCDALEALANAGLADFQGKSVEEIMAEARSLAGPEDARTMVGVDVGGFRVIN